MQTSEPSGDKRRAERRQPALGTLFRLDKANHIGLVWNISTTGISMLVHDTKKAGDMLRGELVSAGERVILPVTLRVAHNCQVRTGDYFVGAQFQSPLANHELQPFLGQ